MRRYVIIGLLLAVSILAKGQEIKLSGVYNGENIIVMNPFGPTGVGFCVHEVQVNGKTSTTEVNSSTFEVDLANYDLSIGSNVEVAIKHKPGCKPKIINAYALKPKSTYQLVDIKFNRPESKLVWKTTNEKGSLPFEVQQFRWNKWSSVAKVKGKGTSGTHQYSAKVPVHSGMNRFRLKQEDYTNRPNYSRELAFQSIKAPVKYEVKRLRSEIVFSNETKYEIFDAYGRKVLSGTGKTVDVSDLDKGNYYLNYDNMTKEVKL